MIKYYVRICIQERLKTELSLDRVTFDTIG